MLARVMCAANEWCLIKYECNIFWGILGLMPLQKSLSCHVVADSCEVDQVPSDIAPADALAIEIDHPPGAPLPFEFTFRFNS